MPLDRKVIAYPLTPPDAGTDPKAVNGLVRADNAHWARQGGVEKRFAGFWEWPYDVEPSFVLAPTNGWAPLFLGKNLRKWNEDTYLFPTMDTGGVVDMKVEALQGKNDGYYEHVTHVEFGDYYLLARMEYGFLYGVGYGLNFWVTTHAKATGELIDSWTRTIYPGVFKQGIKNLCLRPVVGYGGNVYIFYNDVSAASLYYIKADYTTGALTNAGSEVALPGVQNTLGLTALDACLMADGKTICVVYQGDVFPFSQPNVICLDTEYDIILGSAVVAPTEVYAWRVACWSMDDYGDVPTAFVAWFSAWTNQLLVLTVDISAGIVRSKDGAGTPLDLVSLAAGYPATIIAGVTTYEDVHTQDASTASVLMTTRQVSGLDWLFGLATGQHEESTARYDMSCGGSGTTIASATPYPPTWSARQSQLVTKPWLTTDNQFMVVTTSSRNTLVLREGTGKIIGRCLFEKSDLDAYMDGYTGQGFATAVQENPYYLYNDGYQFLFGAVRKEGDRYTMCKVTTEHLLSRLATTYGAVTQANVVDDLFLANSCPYSWDGQDLVEMGFIDQPRFVDATKEIGGNLTNGATYWYQCVWTWVDATGSLHRSVPSAPKSVVLTGSSGGYPYTAVDVRVPACRSTRKAGVKIEVYRTMANGQEPRLVKTLENDEWLSGDTFEFTDTQPDTYLEDKATIYTYGGVLESVAPPPHWIHCVHQGRHFVVDRENRNTHIYYSKALVPGFAIEHSDSFLLRVPPIGGEITGLVSMLDRLVVFKRDAIYVVSGSGPDPNGSNLSFSEPYLASANVGCNNPRSLVQVPEGIMFRSRQQIAMLNKSMQVTMVGEPVRFWTDNCVISGAVARNDKCVAIWFLSSQFLSGDRGPAALVYNWKHNVWTTWSGDRLFCDSVAAMYNDRIWMVDDLRTRYTADTYYYDVHYDAVEGITYTGIPMALETGWISFAGHGGFTRIHRIFLIGQRLSSASDSLRIEASYDYDGYYSELLEYEFSTTLQYDFSQYFEEMHQAPYEDQGMVVEIKPSRQKCTAIKLRIVDVPDGYGKNWSATGLAFVVGVKPQGWKGPATKATAKVP